MSESARNMPATNFGEVRKIQDFFETGGLLTKACDEVGFNYETVRRNIQGETKKVKLIYAVILGAWIEYWKRQEAERRELSKQVPE